MQLLKKTRKYGFGFLAGIVFAMVCFVAVNAVSDRFSSSEYCGSSCHEMNAAYSSWELSAHYANDAGVAAQCIDCHLPPKEKFFRHMAAKSYAGLKDTIKHHFGGEYDRIKMRRMVVKNMPNERCLKCHSSLMVKPPSSGAALAHRVVLNPPEDFKPKCVDCHGGLHEHTKKLF
jgi:cytochrome c-type protein NapC/trimethylamine-N-oxide reductase cytochrome c-type subunit TorC